MSAGNAIVNIRVDEAMLDRMNEELERRNANTKEGEWTLSDYVRAAIREKIAHSDRSRCSKQDKKFRCNECDYKFSMNKLGYFVKPLFSPKVYTCVYCVRVKPAGI